MTYGILIEYFNPEEAKLVESHDADNKYFYLVGRMMAAEQRNLNKRVYPLNEITSAVNGINEQIKNGISICGELNHPDNLQIDLKNVSHIITEAWMEGNNAMGRCKILDTPSGNIVQALIRGGVKLGVSSRGTGNVTNEGIVSDFGFVTLDIVAQPSGPGCFPDVIREAVEQPKIQSLSEALKSDPKAQAYFQREVLKFFESIVKGK